MCGVGLSYLNVTLQQKCYNYSCLVAPEILVPNQLLGYQFGASVVAECLVEAYPNTINYWMKHQSEMLLNK